jgi:hypothetical protein
MAALISENNYLIPESYKDSYAKKGEYLMVITDLEAVDNDISDPVQVAILEAKNEILEEVGDISNEIEAIKKT